MSDGRPHWVRLGRELRRLREIAGLTQRDIARRLRISQTTVDRTESGGPKGKPPAWPKVREWAEATADASPDLEVLRELAEAALDEHFLYRNLMSEGLAAVQEDIRTEEAAARLLRHFNPWGIPGLLQTADYARRVLTMTDYRQAGGVEEALQARLRRQEILHGTGRRLEFVLTEEGLRKRIVPAAVLAAQLNHLAAMATLPSVAVSVVPAGVQAYAMPAFGFVLYEDHADGQEPWAAIELYHDRVIARKPDDVGIYQAQYELLRRPALHADETRALITAAAESLR